MGALTNTLPKPMVSVDDRPLVDHALEIVHDIPNKIANTHYLPEKIEPHLHSRGIKVVREDTLLETGGGLKNAAPLIQGGACFTLNTDSVWIGGQAAQTLREMWNPQHMDALLLTVPIANTRGHNGAGDFSIKASGQLERGGDLVYTGLQIIKLPLIKAFPQTVFSMNLIWDQMAASGRVFGAVFDGIWCDVGHPEGRDIAQQELVSSRKTRVSTK